MIKSRGANINNNTEERKTLIMIKKRGKKDTGNDTEERKKKTLVMIRKRGANNTHDKDERNNHY